MNSQNLLKKLSIVPVLLSFGILVGCSSHEMEMDTVTAPTVDVVADSSGKPIRIEVASNGYNPKNIGVKKGQKVALEFHRADGDNCGEKLVFPELKIEKDLPVGEKVLVEITPTKTGDLKFTCGMDMFRGKLIVSE